MSSELRGQLIGEVVEALRMHQNAVDEVDEAATEYLGINRTDTRCLDIIERRGRVTAGDLATESGLTTGAITVALDRLERAGYVRRVRDATDRRRVLVEVTNEGLRRAMECYGPIAREGQAGLEACTDEQLIFIRDFLRDGYDLLAEHAERVRQMAREMAREKGGARLSR